MTNEIEKLKAENKCLRELVERTNQAFKSVVEATENIAHWQNGGEFVECERCGCVGRKKTKY